MAPTIGDHIARIRRQSTLTQEGLAERAGLSVETIRKLETNQRTSARIPTIHAIARALGVPTSALVGDASTAAARREPDHRPLSLAAIRRAIAPVRGLDGAEIAAPTADPPSLDVLRQRLRSIDRSYHANDYATALAGLPPLLIDARATASIADDANRSQAYALLARVQHLAGNLLIQLRAGDLAQAALSGALDAAQHCDDRVVSATVIKSTCWLLMRQGRLEEAAHLAATTADEVEPRISRATPDELASWGWLLLGAAAAYARDNQGDEVTPLIDAAAAAAVRIGDRGPDDGHLMMVRGFGSALVQMQRAEIAAVIGEPGRVLELSAAVPRDPSPVSSSYNRHRLDVAWALVETRQVAEATAVLAELRDRAPAWLRHQRYARDIVSSIVAGRRRAMSQELADVASLVGCGD